MLLAYGQTGTGKTHTIFGPKDAQLDMSQSEEWGIFPKVVREALDLMSKKGLKFKLFFSAIEFYTGSAFDLLGKNTPITIDNIHGPRCATTVELKTI